MDETRKAASVAQLQELAASVDERFAALDGEEKAETPDIRSMVLGVQQLLEAQLSKAVQEIKAGTPDLTPVLAELKAQGAKISDLIVAVTMLAQSCAAPMEREGTATLSDGTSVQLKITDRKMQ